MARPPEAHLDAARRILAQERSRPGQTPEVAAAAGRVYEALLRSLAPVLGVAGVQALLGRSVRLTRVDFPCLQEILESAPEEQARLADRLFRCLDKLDPAAGAEMVTTLYATLFGLMITLIGEQLVWQIVTRAFPVAVRTATEETA